MRNNSKFLPQYINMDGASLPCQGRVVVVEQKGQVSCPYWWVGEPLSQCRSQGQHEGER